MRQYPLQFLVASIFLMACIPCTGVLGALHSYTYDPGGRLVAADYGAHITTSYAYDNAGNLLQTSTPSPGFAFGPVVNNQFMLTWPAVPGGFTLETSSTLGIGAEWQPLTSALSLAGNTLIATIRITGTNQFFRLKKP